jgi:hypothetical protein
MREQVAEEKAPEEEPQEERPWTPNPQFRSFRYGLDQKNYWRSRGFQEEVSGLDLGDVDGDGQNEVVAAMSDRVEVYRFNDRRLTKIAEYTINDRVPIISLDVADIQKKGRAQIFVSRVSNGRVTSMVLEYANGRLLPIVRDSSYLYRVLEIPPRGRTLLGQRMVSGLGEGQLDMIKTYFEERIETLEWDGRDFVGRGDVPVPRIKGLYIYNFAVGDLDSDRSNEIVMIDQEERLNIYDSLGNRVYRSTEPFGTTLNYIRVHPEKEVSPSRARLEINDLYLPVRILIKDIDGDGKRELVVVKNTSSSPYTSRYKSYSDGKIVVLSWGGMSMDPLWESRRLTGCISDFQIKELGPEQNPYLVVAVIQETEVKLMRDGRSVIVGYGLAKQKQ